MRKLCTKTYEKKNSRNVTSPSYFLITFLFLSLSNKSFQTLEKNLRKATKHHSQKPLHPSKKKYHPHSKMQIPNDSNDR